MADPNHPPVVSIVGRTKSGKTALIEKLIPILKARGYRVGTVKHHARPGFDIDYPGKDTWRHWQAGSDHVVIAAPDKIASITKLPAPLSLPEILESMQDVDIVLTDGYHQANTPKVEVLRAAVSKELLCEIGELIALVTDFELEIGLPRFELDDADGLADLILFRLLDKDT